MDGFFELLDLNPWRAETLDNEEFLRLVASDPSACRQTYVFDAFDEESIYPLHMISALSADADAVKACYKAHPDAIQDTKSGFGSPLHFACFFGAPIGVVVYLAKKDPSALMTANSKSGKTPLHLACESNAKSEVAVFLTEKCSAAAKLTDTLGMTPLHLAVSVDDPQLAVVEDLTEVKAEAGIIRAKDGSWPLWTAINNKVHGSILKDLIVSNPESAKLMDNSTGSTPLHRAVELNLPLSVVKDLIKVYPQALEITNGDDRIPLHVAMECKPTFEVIKLLVQKYPESVELANKDGKTPHEVALQLGLDDDITSFLNPFEED